MKKLVLYGIAMFFLLAGRPANSQTTINGGEIKGTWTKLESPYIINGEITIPSGESLILEKGTKVYFNGKYTLSVQGNITAIGNNIDSIEFTTNISNLNGWNGISFLAPADENDTSKFEYCCFKNILSNSYNNGAIHIDGFQKINFNNCSFTNNQAYNGGAVSLINNSKAGFTNCNFVNNESSNNGGAIFIDNSIAQLSNCNINGNRAGNGYSSNNGGGIYIYYGNAVIESCFITNNIGYSGSAIYVSSSSNLSIDHSTISSHTYSYGGCIYAYGNVDIRNSILYQNGSYIIKNYGGNTQLNYCLYSGNIYNPDFLITNHCLKDEDPLFEVPDTIFSLTWDSFPNPNQTKSPCIDAGDPEAEHDPDGTITDIGANYFPQSSEAPPKAAFSVDHFSGAVPLTVSFTDLSTQALNNISSWEWNFGDGNTSSDKNPTHTYQADGKFSISLKVTNENGQSDSLSYDDFIRAIDGGIIDSSEVWGAWTKTNSPYNIINSVTVPENKTLTIEAGCIIRFFGNFSVDIDGYLKANGTVNDSIIFTNYYEDTLWHSIRFNPHETLSDSSILNFCKIENTKYNNGTGYYNGGGNAIYSNGYNNLRVSNCLLQNNHGGRGGGLFCIGSEIVFLNNTVKNNHVDQYGGGICIENCSPKITGNKIISNYATSNGGGIYFTNSNSIFANNTILNNKSQRSGSGICCSNSDISSVNNAVGFNESLSDYGGGYAILDCSPKITNNSIYNNEASRGNNIYMSGFSTPIFTNCIIYGNNGIYQGSNNNIYISNSESTPKFSYCNIEYGIENIQYNYGSSTIDHDNIMDINPYFTYRSDNLALLSELSPCINVGTTDTSGLNIPATDLLDNQRIFNSRIDIGSCEYQESISNRAPIIASNNNYYEIPTSTSKTISIEFIDPDINDSHSYSISTSTPNIEIENDEDTNNTISFDISPISTWKGNAKIFIAISDNSGEENASVYDTISVRVHNYVNGNITTDTIWQDTIYINDNLYVNDNVMLQVQKGTKVFVSEGKDIFIAGALQAIGSQDSLILFTSVDKNKLWNGIQIRDYSATMTDNDSTILKYCTLEKTKNAFFCRNFSKVIIDHCTIKDNIVSDYLINCYNANISIKHSIFSNNKTAYSNSKLFYLYYSDINFINNLVYNNGISGNTYSFNTLFYSNYSNCKIINNTIAKNDIGNGTCLSFNNGSPTIKNNICFYNSLSNSELYIASNSQAILSNNIFTNALQYQNRFANKNFNALPEFVDTANINFYLKPSSFAINTGTEDTTGLLLSNFDINGNDRVYNNIIDIGAYEYIGAPSNRTPVIVSNISTQFCSVSSIKTISIEFQDPDQESSFTSEVTTDTSSVLVQNIQIENTLLSFDLVPETGWGDTCAVKVTINDDESSTEEINTITFQFIVTNKINVCGSYTGEINWDIDTICISCNTYLQEGSELNIAAGTVIEFQGAYDLSIKGSLNAIGTVNDTILFKRSYLDDITNNVGERIRISSGSSDSCLFNYCRFELGNAEGTTSSGYYNCPLYFNQNGLVSFKNCLFNNPSPASYGAIYTYGGSLEINNCKASHWGNNNHNSGGFLYGNSCNIDISNSVFNNNKSINGAVLYLNSAKANIENCLFNNNIAYRNGGCIFNRYSSTNILNSTFVNNEAIEKGGVIYNDYGSIYDTNTIANSILFYNSADMGPAIYTNSKVSIYYCDLEGGTEAQYSFNTMLTDTSNINIEPYFSDTANHNYQLTDSSYCINSGTTNAAFINKTFSDYDLMGNPRIYNDEIIDMGAYEFQGTAKNRRPIIYCDPYLSTSKNTPRTVSILVSEFDINDIIDIEIATKSSNLTISHHNDTSIGNQYIYNYTFTPSDGYLGSDSIFISVNDNSGTVNALALDTLIFEVGQFQCGTITENTTWDKKIMIECNIVIPDSVTLTINPGTKIEFLGNYSINVYGTICAKGNSNDSIVFTAKDKNTGWKGIKLYEAFPDYVYDPINDTTYVHNVDSTFFKYCRFEHTNEPSYLGGALYVYNHDNVLIENCVFEHNVSEWNGSAIYVYSCSPKINNCRISYNNSSSSALYFQYCFTPHFKNIVVNNSTLGMYFNNSNSKFINCTFKNNSRHLNVENSNIELINNIFWNKELSEHVFNLSGYYSDNVIFNNCNILGLEGLKSKFSSINYISWNNNYDFDPVFKNNSFQLSSSSPCINIGSMAYDSINKVDIMNQPRVYEGSDKIVDLGAHEYQGEPSNRQPSIKMIEEINGLINSSASFPVNFIDRDINDSHTITITSNSPVVSIISADGDTSGTLVTLKPESDWTGNATIYIEVKDNSGEENAATIDSIQYNVSNSVCGTIYGNTTWDYPHIKIECDISIDSNATLTIKPGCTIEFQNQSRFNIYGNFIAKGSSTDSIIFTVPYINQETGWKGMHIFNSTTDSTIFDYCKFLYYNASYIYPDSYNGVLNINNRNRVRLSNSVITGAISQNAAIVCANSNIKLLNNKISHNNCDGISSNKSSLIIISNQISYNNTGINCTDTAFITIDNNIISHNSDNGIYLMRCTGYISANQIFKNKGNNGAGISLNSCPNSKILNNLIAQNTSSGSTYGTAGIGIFIGSEDCLIANNTIADNYNYGLYILAAKAKIVNNIFSNKSNDLRFSNIYIKHNDYDSSKVQFTNCLINDNISSVRESFAQLENLDDRFKDCIFTDPKFQDKEFLNYALDFNSPAFNKGLADTTGLHLPTLDLKGNNRLISDTIDIGAYEFNHSIDNRIPRMECISHYAIRKADSIAIAFDFSDPDSTDNHQITVSSNEPTVSIKNLEWDNYNCTFNVVPDNLFTGNFDVTVTLNDNSFSKNDSTSQTFQIFVGDTFDYKDQNIEHNFTWKTEKVRLFNNVWVRSNNSLKIEAGTNIEFQGNYKLNIQGSILACGNSTDSIYFNINPEIESTWQGLYVDHSYNNNSALEKSRIEYCVFNNAIYGLYLDQIKDIDVSHSRFSENNRGIYLNGSGTISYCHINNNSVNGNGAGIYANSYRRDTINICYNSIHDNISEGYGGGIYGGTNIVGNLIYNNYAKKGGGIYEGLTLVNNSIVKNDATLGGGIFNTENSILINNIIEMNSASEQANEIYFGYNSEYIEFYNNYIKGGLSTFNCGLYEFKGVLSSLISNGNYFIDEENNNYNLSPNSICIDAGTLDSNILADLPLEIVQQLKTFVYNQKIDIGANEFTGSKENRLPILFSKEHFYIRNDKTTRIAIPYLEADINDVNKLEIISDNNKLKYENIHISEDSLFVDLIPQTDWYGQAQLELKLYDQENLLTNSNHDTLIVYVTNTHKYCGNISENTVWEADTIVIECNLIVKKDVKLNIAPGTIINIYEDVNFDVYGIIEAKGTTNKPIIFTSSYTGWDGITLHRTAFNEMETDSCIFDYCVFEKIANYTKGIVSNKVKTRFSNSIFRDNLAYILNLGKGKQKVLNNNFKNNKGICVRISDDNPLIKNNLFEKNEVRFNNFYDANYSCIKISVGEPLVYGNIFRYNKGGVIEIGNSGDSKARIINNAFYDNVPFNETSGGAIHCGYLDYGNEVHIIGNLIYNNISTLDGAGIRFENRGREKAFIINNTIINNHSLENSDPYGSGGGGIDCDNYTKLVLKNNILWENKRDGSYCQIGTWSYQTSIQNSIIQFGIDSIRGNDSYIANIDTSTIWRFNPGLKSIQTNNFRLLNNSLSINKGSIDTAGLHLPILDIAGNKRIVDNRIDLGAYEFMDLNCTDKSSEKSIKICKGDSIRIGSVFAKEEGKYLDYLQTSQGCDSIIEYTLSYFNHIPVDIGNDTSIFNNESITFKTDYDYEHVIWNAFDTTNTYTINANEVYPFDLVHVMVIDNNGCKSSDSISIEFKTPISANYLYSEKFVVHPNPTRGIFRIDNIGNTETSIVQYQIYNILGELVFDEKECLLSAVIDISSQKPGLYTLNILNSDKREFSIKIVLLPDGF